MAGAQTEAWGNPSSVHQAGRRALALVERARASVADLLGLQARDVLFASSATEANNLALHAARALVTSHLEHPSVTRVAERLAASGTPVEWLTVQPNGTVDLDTVELALRRVPRGALVALMGASHETGVVQPVREVAEESRDDTEPTCMSTPCRCSASCPPPDGRTTRTALRSTCIRFGGPKGSGSSPGARAGRPNPSWSGAGRSAGSARVPSTRRSPLACWWPSRGPAPAGGLRAARAASRPDRTGPRWLGCGQRPRGPTTAPRDEPVLRRLVR